MISFEDFLSKCAYARNDNFMLVCLLPSKKYDIMLILIYDNIFCFQRKFLKSLSEI